MSQDSSWATSTDGRAQRVICAHLTCGRNRTQLAFLTQIEGARFIAHCSRMYELPRLERLEQAEAPCVVGCDCSGGGVA